jgi:sporulation protein YlmC with PRC-barrel domain
MILTELLKLPVLDATGERVGVVADLRFELDPQTGEARLLGVLVGRRAHSVFLGYERNALTAPALIARFLRWRERGAFLVLLRDVRTIDENAVRLGPAPVRYSPALP